MPVLAVSHSSVIKSTAFAFSRSQVYAEMGNVLKGCVSVTQYNKELSGYVALTRP